MTRFLRDAVVTIVLLIVIVCVVAYASVSQGGLSADATPGPVERTIAGRLVQLSIPADSRNQANPFAANAEAWRDAADHFGDHCATCHGKDGRGHTDIGQYMYPKVPDLSSQTTQQMTDGALFYIIQNGVRWTGMPGWQKEHSPEETWKLVSFVRHVPSLPLAEPEESHEHHHR